MSEKLTIEQSAAQQIGESITCWLANRLDNNEEDFKASISIGCVPDDTGRIQVSMKATERIKSDPTEFEFIVEDPAQLELPAIGKTKTIKTKE